MAKLWIFVLITVAWAARGQSVATVNFNYLYAPTAEVSLSLRVINQGASAKVVYYLAARGTDVDQYQVSWEKRDSFTQRQGVTLPVTDSIVQKNSRARLGWFNTSLDPAPWLLVAKVSHAQKSEPWLFAKLIDANYPIDGALQTDSGFVFEPYVPAAANYSWGQSKATVFFYATKFPAAAPPFAETSKPIDPILQPDSVVKQTSGLVKPKAGLYLVQRDTTAAFGFSFRVHAGPFPKYARLQDLVDPLIFVCTQQEFGRLQKAADKAAFDQVILDITRDKERARNFMRHYFRRVELANRFFSSYKEGWKTDRGMIYIIFGPPDDVRLANGTETWTYATSRQRFTFRQSGSVFDPDYYVLQRERKSSDAWYQTIDLWRKARFTSD